MTEPLATIRSFWPISNTLATAGQPTAEQFAAIASAGYDLMINLALPTSDHALPDEQAIVTRLGMDYVAIPVVWEEPTLADLTEFFQAMDTHAGRRIFVHCAANMRVSAFVYLYRRLRLGLDEAIALADLHALWHPTPRWQQFIDQAVHARAELISGL